MQKRSGFIQIKLVYRHLFVIGKPLDIGAGGHNHQIVENIFAVSFAVQGVQKSLANVDIREEIRRDTVAVQFAAADIRIAGGVDFLAKERK